MRSQNVCASHSLRVSLRDQGVESLQHHLWRDLIFRRIALKVIDDMYAIAAEQAQIARESGMGIKSAPGAETGDSHNRFTLTSVLIKPAQREGIAEAQRPFAQTVERERKDQQRVSRRPDIRLTRLLKLAPDFVAAHVGQALFIEERARAGGQDAMDIPTGSLRARETIIDQRSRRRGTTDQIQRATSSLPGSVQGSIHLSGFLMGKRGPNHALTHYIPRLKNYQPSLHPGYRVHRHSEESKAAASGAAEARSPAGDEQSGKSR